MRRSRRALALLGALCLGGCAHGELRVARLRGAASRPPSASVRVVRRPQDLHGGQEIAWIEITGDDDLELANLVGSLRETARELGADVLAMVRVDRVLGAVRIVAVALRR